MQRNEVSLSREDAVHLCMALKFKTPGNWSNTSLAGKLQRVLALVNSDMDFSHDKRAGDILLTILDKGVGVRITIEGSSEIPTKKRYEKKKHCRNVATAIFLNQQTEPIHFRRIVRDADAFYVAGGGKSNLEESEIVVGRVLKIFKAIGINKEIFYEGA